MKHTDGNGKGESMADKIEVIDALERCHSYGRCDDDGCPYYPTIGCLELLRKDALELLRPLVEAKKPENLRERRAGRTRVHLGDCPVCHRVVEFAQKHCHNCVQLLDWTEVLEMPCEDEDSFET